MGGQDGYQRDMVAQETDSTTVVGGFQLKPNDTFKLGFSLAQTNSDQKMNPFDLSAPEYVATHPAMSYDFSMSHMWSMIDLDRIDLNIDANFKFNDDFWMNVYVKGSEFDDHFLMFEDLNGTVAFFGAYLGWNF